MHRIITKGTILLKRSHIEYTAMRFSLQGLEIRLDNVRVEISCIYKILLHRKLISGNILHGFSVSTMKLFRTQFRYVPKLTMLVVTLIWCLKILVVLRLFLIDHFHNLVRSRGPIATTFLPYSQNSTKMWILDLNGYSSTLPWGLRGILGVNLDHFEN
jgi:hypothetical protein